MSLYEIASMLARQFVLVLFHNKTIKRGEIRIIPTGKHSGVYINPKDATGRS